MAFAGTKFQRAGGTRPGINTFYPSYLVNSGSEGWITEDSLVTIAISDSLGLRSRVCRVAISNPNSVNEDKYSVMHRVRVLDEFGVVIFSGRVVDIRPDFSRAEVHLTCTDYLSDISDKTIMADLTGGEYTGASRAHIVNQILYHETWYGQYRTQVANNYLTGNNVSYRVWSDHVRTLLGRVAVDPSNYLEKITAKYANKDHWTRKSVSTDDQYGGAANPDTPFEFDYRGIKTGAEAISELANSDTQQDLMAIGWVTSAHIDTSIYGATNPIVPATTITNRPGIPGNSPEELEYLQTHYAFYWKDFTSDLIDGTAAFVPLFSTNASNKFYLGSNSKFTGITYGFHQRGDTMGDVAYGDMTWEYWNGTNWIPFVPKDDDKFSVSQGSGPDAVNTGLTRWDYSDLINWTRRDLGATPELGHVWTAGSPGSDSTANITGTFGNTEAVTGNNIQSQGIWGESTPRDLAIGNQHGLVDSTYRYWVRVGTASVSNNLGSQLSHIKLYTDRSSSTLTERGTKTLVRDYYATDPVFPEVIWEYTQRAGTDSTISYPGGSWTDRGADVNDVRTLWNDESNSGATFLSSIDSHWYIGTEQPNSGFELHAVQGRKVGINSISTNVSNAISISTAGVHGLTTNDKVLIVGSDSENSIDNFQGKIVNDAGAEVAIQPYVVTVVNTTTFTIDITSNISGTLTVYGSGSAGTVITGMPEYLEATTPTAVLWQQFINGAWVYRNQNPNNSSEAATVSSNLNFNSWKWDSGSEGAIPHWYLEVRFDTRQETHDHQYRDHTNDWGLGTAQTHPGLNHVLDIRQSPFLPDFMGATTIAIANDGVTDAGSTTRVATSSAHTILVGDHVVLSSSVNYAPNLNGVYEVLAINTGGTNFDIRDVGVTRSGTGTLTCTQYTYPPNGKSLYWTKVTWNSGTAPLNPANIVSIRTANQSHLKYYDRGKEPWQANRGTANTFDLTSGRSKFSGTASSCVHPLDFFAAFDDSGNDLLTDGSGNAFTPVSKLSGAINNSATTLTLDSSAIDQLATNGFLVGTALQIYDPNVANPTSERVRLSSRTNATTIVVERGQDALGDGNAAVAHADDALVSSVVDDTTFWTRTHAAHSFEIQAIAITRSASTTATVTVRHNMDPTGTYVVEPFPLIAGDLVHITGADSTPDISATGIRIKNVRSSADNRSTSFDIVHGANVTAAGGAGTVYVYNSAGYTLFPTGQSVGDIVYFGAKEPFTQLRFDLGDTASLTEHNANFTITWEYFADDTWGSLQDLFDGTDDFKCAPNTQAEVHWRMPTQWRPVQPNKMDGPTSYSSVDHTQGWAAGPMGFYVRARITADSGTVGIIKVKQISYGPDFWNNVTKEVGTLDGLTSTRHAEPFKYGMTLDESRSSGDGTIQMLGYSVGDRPSEFINKVVVRGQAGAYGTSEDQESIDNFHITREKNFYDTSISTSVAAVQKAQALLDTLKPGGLGSSIRECHVTTQYWPVYSHLRHPRAVRVGDLVNIRIPTKDIIDETWLLASISYDPIGAGCQMVLYRDLDRVIEAGTGSTKVLRDLNSRTRELARASFTTLDTVVDSGMTFLPDGPAKIAGRLAYEPIGDMRTAVSGSSAAGVLSKPDELRWNFNLFSDVDTNIADRPQLRLDLTRVRPDQSSGSSTSTAESSAQVTGAGLTFISRRQYRRGSAYPGSNSGRKTNVAGQTLPVPISDAEMYSRDHFYPEMGEATMYLRSPNPDGILRSSNYATDGSSPGTSRADEQDPADTNAMLGSGLYLAHRGIFDWYGNAEYDHSSVAVNGFRNPLRSHHEVFVGISGVTRITSSNSQGKKTLSHVLDDLKARPMVFLQVDTSENPSSGATNNYAGVTAEIDSWVTATVNYGGSSTYNRTVFRGFTIALKNSDGDYFDQAGDGCNVYYLVVFNSARDGAYYGGPGNSNSADWSA